ncbi:GNAT family N-acetyltransferase [Staphylococcus gallinarum]|nr:GNAT family N-acetyltransferase [Staphylococcus gallinarum]MBU7216529.1 GNAT family N-acetyltransferase [Staphylococcus gallinarum]MCD8793613.1 GNAT family N-acetyltransferase [Staphylococcus gallinarum]MCD8829124.1 GNAT family N-acetyltransferase [Staphylococcus gallinarum]MCD8917389.1 GNAT family N-acetyltransferase [Staphylococcus gallinarum]MDN6414194.1 GNAT family N-acetyltransferase [Staphylococcus gallinarum]
MIFKLEDKSNQTLNILGDIWLKTNIETHNFIDKSYWIDNQNDVIKAFKSADIFIFKESDKIKGFCGVINGYIAGIFVKNEWQSKGIGSLLIKYLQNIYDSLNLKVYKNNIRAVAFYKLLGFHISGQEIDETNNIEYLMSWNKKEK